MPNGSLMNEVKAFIRKQKAEEVVDGLEAQGFCCMTMIEAMGLGKLSDPDKSKLSIQIAERFSQVLKLVLVCREEDTDEVIDIILKHAQSGRKGDGIIYVTPVSKTVHVRTGQCGDEILQSRH